MKIIVPLAGPDFILSDGRVKADIDVAGKPLLRHALESRGWWRNGQATEVDLTFVMQDHESTRQFYRERLSQWYPAARLVLLDGPARGAALSALAAVSLVAHEAGPVCIDLADILFESDFDPILAFSDHSAGAAVLGFTSQDAIYSYLRTDESGMVVEAAEKRVISTNASAGVYFFASASVYLRALANNLEHADSIVYNGNFFVCPMVNGVVQQSLGVMLSMVENVVDIKSVR